MRMTLFLKASLLATSLLLATLPAHATNKAKAKPAATAVKAKSKAAAPTRQTVTYRKGSAPIVSHGPGKVRAKAIANARRQVRVARVNVMPDRPAMTENNPGLQSSAVLVLNEQTGEVLYQKNPDQVSSIASISKLMTAMVVLDAHLPLNELISITDEDVDTLKGTSSRLVVGTTLTRGELLLLALMSSENRAAAALARAYPGGRDYFIRAMNEKANALGMHHSRFFDPTGLTPRNVATPRELAIMVQAARHYPEIQQFTTASEYSFNVPSRDKPLVFHNTNPLVNEQGWQIGLSKTGYINEAGKCLVMQARIDGKPVVMVLLDSNGRYTRIGDAQRVKSWLENIATPRGREG